MTMIYSYLPFDIIFCNNNILRFFYKYFFTKTFFISWWWTYGKINNSDNENGTTEVPTLLTRHVKTCRKLVQKNSYNQILKENLKEESKGKPRS
jgi:hypothetical protein